MNESETKLFKLKQLGSKRKHSCYRGHFPVDYFHDGKYESDFVSPYTKTANNVDSSIVVLLQDWSSHDKLIGAFNIDSAELGHTRSLPTNRNLKILLSETFGLQLNQVFATNVFPFIKPGGMSSKIPRADMVKAFKEFCYPQIEIVKPDLVICCGKESYTSALEYFGKPKESLDLVCNQFQKNGILFYHQLHTGSNATNFNGGIEYVKRNWLRMKKDYEQYKSRFTNQTI